MKKQVQHRSLGIKISLTVILILFTVMGSFALILYCYFQNTIRSQLTKIVDTAGSSNGEVMLNQLRRIETACDLVNDNKMIYSNEGTEVPPITRLVVGYAHSRDADALRKLIVDYSQSLKLFNDYFTTCFGENTGYSNILFVDGQWPIHQVMPRRTLKSGGNGFSKSTWVVDEDWYQRAWKQEGEAYWFVEHETGQLCMAQRLNYRYVEGGMHIAESPLGVIAVKFDLSAISKNLDLSSLTPDSRVLLYDGWDSVVYANSSDGYDWSVTDMLKSRNQLQDGTLRYKGKTYLVQTVSLPLGLNMMTLVPDEDIYRMAEQTIRIIIVLCIVLAGVAVFLTMLLSSTIFKPLREFAAYMEKGSTERFVFDHARRDELGTLYRSYNRLMNSLDESMRKQVEEKEKRREIELRALQLQINPHFTYNTLNSISCLAMLNGQDRIAELIGNLTRILRYNISNPSQLVQVQEEVDLIRRYENIQKSCYRDTISFEYDIAPETKPLLIPKLIVQPLVENALMYGMDPKGKTVYIKLSISLEQDCLVISVWDSGKDADVDRINRYIAGELACRVDSLGVRNVYERINLAYGDDAGLNYQKDAQGHTVALIRIPEASLKQYHNRIKG